MSINAFWGRMAISENARYFPLETPVAAAIPDTFMRFSFSSCRLAAPRTAASRKIEFTSLILNPQSNAKLDRGSNNFLSAFLAAT